MSLATSSGTGPDPSGSTAINGSSVTTLLLWEVAAFGSHRQRVLQRGQGQGQGSGAGEQGGEGEVDVDVPLALMTPLSESLSRNPRWIEGFGATADVEAVHAFEQWHQQQAERVAAERRADAADPVLEPAEGHAARRGSVLQRKRTIADAANAASAASQPPRSGTRASQQAAECTAVLRRFSQATGPHPFRRSPRGWREADERLQHAHRCLADRAGGAQHSRPAFPRAVRTGG
jgi:hypothetical protein